MQIKTFLKWCIKAIVAGFLSIIVMTVFCLIYSNTPIHFPNKSGATDYNWTPNSFYSRFTEGIAHGKTNNEGLVNTYDYVDGMNVDVLVMGSSHMEGMNVAQGENTATRLHTFMKEKTVYNIGISGHTFLTCCSNFEAAIQYYKPSDYVIIETSKLNFTADELDSVIEGTLPEIADHSRGIIGFLSRNPFLRLTYSQLKGFMGKEINQENTDESVNECLHDTNNSVSLNNVLTHIAKIASKNETKIIIFYHPTTQVDSDGSLLLPDNMEDRKVFSDLCENNGIIFLDMTDRFQQEYNTNHILPHGFCNSSVGSGHLNKFGHEMIAEELYKIIEQ